MRTRAALAAILFLGVALAGCTGGEDDAPEAPSPRAPRVSPLAPRAGTQIPADNGSANLTLRNLTGAELFAPTLAIVGVPFTVNVSVTGENTTVERIELFADDVACATATGAAPANFTLTCTVSYSGTVPLRATVRLPQNQTIVPPVVSVRAREPVGAYEATLTGTPTFPVTRGASFDVRVAATGDAPDHATFEARFGPNSTDLPATQAYPIVCTSRAQEVPGEAILACTVPADAPDGAYYLRGRVAIDAGPWSRAFWSIEEIFVVT